MKVAMLSCNTGEGHNSTARAIQDVLRARGVECDIVDALGCVSPKFSNFICNWHARLYKYAPKLWDVGYRAAENTEIRLDEKAMLSDFLSYGAEKLRPILEKGNYDALVCVHVFSGLFITELRRTWDRKLPCYLVATDYTCYPYTEQCEMDGYMIPAKALTEQFLAAGLTEDKLIPTGIPVRQEFYRHGDKAEARRKLNLPENVPIILLMGGSMGCGPMKKIAKDLARQLPEDALAVAVCGKNEKLFESLSALDDPGLRVLGFTKEISDYMDAADVIVTKPGGLSATEAANKRLPMVFINAVGGCESPNFELFLSRGYALGSAEPEAVVEYAVKLAADPEKREKMSAALAADFNQNSAERIADIVMEAAR